MADGKGVLCGGPDQVTGAAADSLDQHRFWAPPTSSTRSAPTDVLWASPSVSRVMGWEPEDIIGRRPWDLVHPDDVPVAVASMSRANATSADTRLEIRLRDRTGRYHWMSAAGHPVLRDGVVTSHVVGLRDVTDEHDARALMEAVFNSALETRAAAFRRDVGGTIVDFEYADANDIACAHMRMGAGGNRRHIRSIRAAAAGRSDVRRRAESGRCARRLGLPHQQPGKAQLRHPRCRRRPDVVSFAWRDVTDRHAAARSLMAPEEQFRLVENAYDVIMRKRLDMPSHGVPVGADGPGLGACRVGGQAGSDRIHPEDVGARSERSRQRWPGDEARHQRSATATRWWMALDAGQGRSSVRRTEPSSRDDSCATSSRDRDAVASGLRARPRPAHRLRTAAPLSMLEAAIEDGRGAFVLLYRDRRPRASTRPSPTRRAIE
jgi:PAS domain S-box-containing protein